MISGRIRLPYGTRERQIVTWDGPGKDAQIAFAPKQEEWVREEEDITRTIPVNLKHKTANLEPITPKHINPHRSINTKLAKSETINPYPPNP